MSRLNITIEGLTAAELLPVLMGEAEPLVLSGEPVVFRAGSATVLGQFSRDGEVLRVELAHIDGGGEGVLPTLVALAHSYARARGLTQVEWLVYATNCARPNPKLQRVLQRRGFAVVEVEGKGPCYHQLVHVRSAAAE